MTEQVYPRPLQSFKTDVVPTPVFTVPIMEQGAAALEQINEVWDKGWTPATLSALCCCCHVACCSGGQSHETALVCFSPEY